MAWQLRGPARDCLNRVDAALLIAVALLLVSPALSGGSARTRDDVGTAAHRLILWVNCQQTVLPLTDTQLDIWKARGVDGFVCMTGRLRGLGGAQDYSGDPSVSLASANYSLQRSLRDTRIVERARARGMKLYLGVKLANFYQDATPLVEWFNDAGWSRDVLPNMRNLAAGAKLLGFAGIALDQELYPSRSGASTATWTWDYPGNTRSEEQVRAKARQRGAELMGAILGGFPGAELAVYHAFFPGGWNDVVQEVVNEASNASADLLHIDFWDGMTSVGGYGAIRFFDSIFTKAPHVGSWENALSYNANQLLATFSRRFSNWDYASGRVHVSSFGWIDEGPKPSPFDDARSPEHVAEQLLAFRKWGMGGEFANYAFVPLADFDYSPYVPAMQAGSRPGEVDSVDPTLELTGTTGLTIEGTAHDNLAIRAVRWRDDRGQSGVARMRWEVLAGDYDSGYQWQTRWSFSAADISPAATRVEVIAEDIKGNESRRVVLGFSEGHQGWMPVGDEKAPETTITKKPKKRSPRRLVFFGYRSSRTGSSFECRVDGRSWKSCNASGKRYRLSRQRHTFRVRASDAAGKSDPTPAVYRFRIVQR